MSLQKPKVSMIVPAYNEQETIEEFYRRASGVADSQSSYEFEFVFVDDGSRDKTPMILARLAVTDPRVKVLHLARNCGHQIAITAGLDFALGDVAVIIDADLQDPPELVGDMLERIKDGFDIVHAQRRHRDGESWFKLLSAGLFYRMMNRFAGTDLVRDAGDFRAITRPAIETIRRFREPHRFMRGLFSAMGFRQVVIQYDRDARFAGETKYPLRKMIKLAVTALVGFSTAPLRIITGLALAMWGVSLFYIGDALYRHFVLETTVSGWTSLAILVSFSTGLTLICLNIVGAYVGRVYEQGFHRPLYWLSEARNLDVTNPSENIGKTAECELSLAILRSRDQSPMLSNATNRGEST